MSQHHKRMTGWARQQRNTRVLAAHGDTCHICGHPGADAVDHVIPLAKGGTDAFENLLPAHHDIACAVCGEQCNRAKSARIIAPIIKHSGSLTRP